MGGVGKDHGVLWMLSCKEVRVRKLCKHSKSKCCQEEDVAPVRAREHTRAHAHGVSGGIRYQGVVGSTHHVILLSPIIASNDKQNVVNTRALRLFLLRTVRRNYL